MKGGSAMSESRYAKYIITEVDIPNPGRFHLVYQDEAVRVYENLGAMPRAFTLSLTATTYTDDLGAFVQSHDLRSYIVLGSGDGPAAPDAPRICG